MELVEEIKTLEEDVVSWRSRILYPTLIGGIVGGGIGAVSKHRKVHGLANMSATYATNLAIVTGCYCGAREIVKATRHSGPHDLLDSAIAGFSTGGRAGAIRYSIGIAIAGIGVDFVGIKLRSYLEEMYESVIGGEKKDSWMRWPNDYRFKFLMWKLKLQNEHGRNSCEPASAISQKKSRKSSG